MKNVYIKEQDQHGKDFFWKFLCVCLDNEGLGFLERLLTVNKIEFKTQEFTDACTYTPAKQS